VWLRRFDEAFDSDWLSALGCAFNSALRCEIVVASADQIDGAPAESSKHDTAPVWHAGPADLTRATIAALSQSDVREMTFCTFPLVAPFRHRPRVRER